MTLSCLVAANTRTGDLARAPRQRDRQRVEGQ